MAICCQLLMRSEEHTSELQSRLHLVCRLLLEKKKADAARPRGRLGFADSVGLRCVDLQDGGCASVSSSAQARECHRSACRRLVCPHDALRTTRTLAQHALGAAHDACSVVTYAATDDSLPRTCDVP